MGWTDLWLRLRALASRSRAERDLDDELSFHLQMEERQARAAGAPEDEARRAARINFGGVDKAREECRDARGVAALENLARDLRYSLRVLVRSPAFTTVAVLSLALGIGANVAIFTVVNAAMLRSLPVDHPERLVAFGYALREKSPFRIGATSGHGNVSLSYAAFEELRAKSGAMSGVFAFASLGLGSHEVTVNAGGEPGMAAGEMVSGGYFTGIGVSTILGRAISDDDMKPGAPNVAVLSYRYWSRQLGAERSAVGSSIAINGTPFTVVGIAPPQFFGANPRMAPDLWIPLRETPNLYPWGVRIPSRPSQFADPNWWWCDVMGRLAPGVSAQQARAELELRFQNSLHAASGQSVSPEDLPHLKVEPASRGLDELREFYSEPLRILAAVVGLVLLLACVNVATLLLARANARQREMGMRLALGAGRGRLIRQLLIESVVLSLAGGLLGIVFAQWGSRILVLMMASRDGALGLDIHPDPAVLAFTAAVSLLTGVLFGIAPAFRATRADPAAQYRQAAGRAAGRFHLARVLLAGQVAFSVVLLFGAGLFVRTLQKLEGQEFGFNRDNLLLFSLNPRPGGYEGERLVARYSEILDGLRAVPGVRSATASAFALLSGWMNGSSASADAGPIPQGDARQVYWNIVGPDFLDTMGMRLALGRDIDFRDIRGNRRVAVINETMARRFFPGGSPVGRRFCLKERFDPSDAYEVVGVSRDAKFDSVRADVPATAYVPYAVAGPALGKLCFELRTPGDPATVLPGVRRAVRAVDPSLPMIDVKTQAEQVAEALAQEHMFARLTGFFGLLALLLVAIGIYGTLAYTVTRRTGEIGVRVALGARRGQVLWMVLRESALVIACGVAVGLPAALALTRYVASMLFGVKPHDPAAIAAMLLLLTTAGATAGLIPAHRASRIDAMSALRYE
jgi:predicted permease